MQRGIACDLPRVWVCVWDQNFGMIHYAPHTLFASSLGTRGLPSQILGQFVAIKLFSTVGVKPITINIQ